MQKPPYEIGRTYTAIVTRGLTYRDGMTFDPSCLLNAEVETLAFIVSNEENGEDPRSQLKPNSRVK